MAESAISKAKKWANTIKKRDARCLKCSCEEALVAHHILSWSKFPEDRFKTENGITLCCDCHKIFHELYGNLQTTPKNIELFLQNKQPTTPVKIENEYEHLEFTGEKYGRWKTSDTQIRKGRKYYLACKCDCGVIRLVAKASLKNGKSQSCGCLHKEKLKESYKGKNNPQYKHGNSCKNSWSKEYRAWVDMKTRCNNKNCRAYDLYGGRGINVCEEWINDFEKFLVDMKVAPSKKHRVDPDGNYEKENCRWATRKEQMRNIRNNCLLSLNGKTKTAIEWSETLNIKVKTIYTRKSKGWSDKDCLMEANNES